MNKQELKSKLDELGKIHTLTDDQKKQKETFESDLKGMDRYEELYAKPTDGLSEKEAEELLGLSERFMSFENKKPVERKVEEKPVEEKVEEKPVEVEEPKKYAGIYDSIEDLAKGILNSESERKRIASDHPELVGELEKFYKSSQREVTKLVSEKKSSGIDILPKPLNERKFTEMRPEEYKEWQTEDPMAAQAWLSKAQKLFDDQAMSGRKILNKHPDWLAMIHGVVPQSKEYQEYDRVCRERSDLLDQPNAAELAYEEFQKSFKPEKSVEKSEDKPKVKPREETPKPDFAQGKVSSGPKKSTRLTEDEFERLSPTEQRAYMANSIRL